MPQANMTLSWSMVRQLFDWPDDVELLTIGMTPVGDLVFHIAHDTIPADVSEVNALYRSIEAGHRPPQNHLRDGSSEFAGFQAVNARITCVGA